mgnify:FL=1
MFKINDYLVYRKEVCKVTEIKEYKNDFLYYVITPINDTSLKIEVPTDSSVIRPLISKIEIQKIIEEIPNIKEIAENNRLLENKYRELLKSGTYNDLITIIKTTYLRNETRDKEKKKRSEKDTTYFNLAEKYLYTEFSVVLGKSYEDTKKYVISKVKEINLEKENK